MSVALFFKKKIGSGVASAVSKLRPDTFAYNLLICCGHCDHALRGKRYLVVLQNEKLK